MRIQNARSLSASSGLAPSAAKQQALASLRIALTCRTKNADAKTCHREVPIGRRRIARIRPEVVRRRMPPARGCAVSLLRIRRPRPFYTPCDSRPTRRSCARPRTRPTPPPPIRCRTPPGADVRPRPGRTGRDRTRSRGSLTSYGHRGIRGSGASDGIKWEAARWRRRWRSQPGRICGSWPRSPWTSSRPRSTSTAGTAAHRMTRAFTSRCRTYSVTGGRRDLAHRVLEHIERNLLEADGSFRDPAANGPQSLYLYQAGWLAWGSAFLGRFDLARRFARRGHRRAGRSVGRLLERE